MPVPSSHCPHPLPPAHGAGRLGVGTAVLAGILVAACSGEPEVPTYAADVAPILFTHCAGCHRPGESAPFALLTYADAHRKRRQIAAVTRRRQMPPWLPEPGHEKLVGARRVTEAEVDLLAGWVAGGAPEGDPSVLPPTPRFPEGWQLRQPDLVLTPERPFDLPAAGPDVFHNFLIPVPADALRFVLAVEIRPDHPAVHHAILQVDETRESRRLAGGDPGRGFPGMSLGVSEPPDGHFLGWTPGKRAREAPPDMAWRLRPGSDLVLQVHLTPTGKPERIRPRVGLFFTSVPPRRRPYPVTLYSETIDIPAGETDYRVEDAYRLPVAVQLVQVYPHAHYLCRTMHGYATLPDGTVRSLFRIGNWDFDWQDDYRFLQPVSLPAGTTLHLDFHYDNSAANPDNPYQPPRRAKFGPTATDEMGTLTFTVIPGSEADRLALREATGRHRLAKQPEDPEARRDLAAVLRERGGLRAALVELRAGLQAHPEHPGLWIELGRCQEAAGRGEQAIACFDKAIRADPDAYFAHLCRGQVLAALDRGAAAEDALRRALRLSPELVDAQVLLGNLLARRGETGAAIALFRRASRGRPGTPEIHNNLATALFTEGDLAAAEAEYRRALELQPEYFNARFNLGRLLRARGRPDAARTELLRAAKLQPEHPGLRAELERRRP